MSMPGDLSLRQVKQSTAEANAVCYPQCRRQNSDAFRWFAQDMSFSREPRAMTNAPRNSQTQIARSCLIRNVKVRLRSIAAAVGAHRLVQSLAGLARRRPHSAPAG